MKTLLAFFLPLVFLLPAHAQEAGNPLRYGKKSGRIVSGTGYAVTKGHVKKHMAEGRWKTVSAANGNVLQVHRYSKGYYDGEQDYYNEDLVAGKSLLVTKSFYRMGRKDSAWISYNSKGAVIWISHYHLDTLMSDSSWSADGKLLMAKSYRADGFVTTQCFWPNGRVRSASTLNGTKHEGWVIDNPDSGWKDSLPQFYSHYSGGKKDGGERARLSGGYSMTCNWKSGLYDGEFRLFYPGGKIEFSGQFRDGIKTGAWKYYSPSGVLLQTTWFHNGCFLPAGNSTREYDTLPQPPPDSVYTFDGNGRLSCISRSALRPEEFTGYLSETFLARTHEQFFDTTGYIKEEGDLSGTRKDGTWKTFYPGGKLRSSLDYVSGTANGTYTVFYPGGKKMITAEVNDFLAVKAVFYGKDGKPLALSSPKVDEMSGQWF
ncbi:MAG TPA: hypothetical protein VFU15_04855, partial [Bacteroidia bacterium]|nr:hypothetical protein [Bacteroidia bacterium]